MNPIRPATDRHALALDALALPVQIERAQVPRHPRLWQSLAVLGCLLIGAELLYLSQAYWLQLGSVRNALNPLFVDTSYSLKRPLVAAAWQVSDLTWQVSASTPHLYQLDARVVNRADILQPWPTLRLSLRDRNGIRLTSLDLPPKTYLPVGATLPHLAGSDQPLRISLPIQLLARENGTWPIYAAIELSPRP